MDGSSSRRFRSPEEVSDAAWVASVGGVATPLLGGFSLASVIVVSDDAGSFWLPGAAILALTVAATFFIAAVQFAQIAGRSYAARADLPISGRTRYEDKKVSGFTKDGYDKRAVAFNRAKRWDKWARRLYHGGIFAWLIALALALMPKPGASEPVLRWIAVGVAVTACVAETLFRSEPTDFGADRTANWMQKSLRWVMDQLKWIRHQGSSEAAEKGPRESKV